MGWGDNAALLIKSSELASLILRGQLKRPQTLAERWASPSGLRNLLHTSWQEKDWAGQMYPKEKGMFSRLSDKTMLNSSA